MNNYTNLTNPVSLEQQSVNDLNEQLGVNIGIFVVSFSTVLSNLGVLFGLYKGRKIKFTTHHYKLICHMSAVACFQAFFIFVVMGVIRLIDTAFRIPANMSVKNCGLLLLIFEITLIVDAYNVFVLAVDRLAAIVVPFHYNAMKSKKEYKILTIATPWMFGIIDGCTKCLLWTNDYMQQNLSICLLANTRTAGYTNYKYYRSLIFGTVTILLYLIGIIYVKYKIYMDKNNATQLKKDVGFKLMVTCAIDALVYTTTYYLSQIYGSIILVYATPHARNILGPISVMLIFLATTPRFFILYFSNAEFKMIIKKLFNPHNQIFVVWGKSMVADSEKIPS